LKTRASGIVVAALLAVGLCACAGAPAPSGLAASALDNPGFTWLHRSVAGFRVYFKTGGYAARHQDSLLARLPASLRHARDLLHTTAPDGPIDVFFVESRDDMSALIGAKATGFADQAARAVFLVNNPSWRAFDRHEIMHVVSFHAWGPPAPNNDWLQEGLAQAADGRCGDYTNEAVLRGFTQRHGWVSLEDMLVNFRQQPDLRAYLQAAAFTRYLLDTFGPEALRLLWQRGATPDTEVGGRSLADLEAQWRARIAAGEQPAAADLAAIEETGCGVTRWTR